MDLLGLPAGTLLRLGPQAEVRLTGLRTPCTLIDSLQPRLTRRMWGTDEAGRRTRRAGVMTVMTRTGVVRPGDPLTVVLPAAPASPLAPV